MFVTFEVLMFKSVGPQMYSLEIVISFLTIAAVNPYFVDNLFCCFVFVIIIQLPIHNNSHKNSQYLVWYIMYAVDASESICCCVFIIKDELSFYKLEAVFQQRTI